MLQEHAVAETKAHEHQYTAQAASTFSTHPPSQLRQAASCIKQCPDHTRPALRGSTPS